MVPAGNQSPVKGPFLPERSEQKLIEEPLEFRDVRPDQASAKPTVIF
jgi:hypothetical protein